ncbi:MAG: hypothetical protein F4Z16_11830 [Rhodothermaceae bacterium]|nr:hypothetical protein [Bacteroidota bacterium]MXZ59154.1 hypothetical protein [Rhodothermaceae bacterium]MYB90268.1 hypothetical protein [Rhodothermaceae bacterium]MYD68556.1 hypothetical protein [Rhodothermaceae bacterium]MYG45688.1 hypothetical protein [Rhodothermaceae bacterium]
MIQIKLCHLFMRINGKEPPPDFRFWSFARGSSYQHLILEAGTEQYQPTSICSTMTNRILQTTKHTAKMLSVAMLLSFLTVASKAEIPDPSIIPIENTFLTVVAKAEIPEASTVPSKNSGNCECLKTDQCFDLMMNCMETAIDAYESGRSSAEMTVLFLLKICPQGFIDCVEDLYGLE